PVGNGHYLAALEVAIPVPPTASEIEFFPAGVADGAQLFIDQVVGQIIGHDGSLLHLGMDPMGRIMYLTIIKLAGSRLACRDASQGVLQAVLLILELFFAVLAEEKAFSGESVPAMNN